jgi:hypothetical protein
MNFFFIPQISARDKSQKNCCLHQVEPWAWVAREYSNYLRKRARLDSRRKN